MADELGLQENYSIFTAEGSPYDEAIAVPGLLAANTLLAVIGHGPGLEAVGFDPNAFVVSADSIVSETADTDGYKLTIVCR